MSKVSAEDRKLIKAMQAGLPRVDRPWRAIGEEINMSEAEVLERVRTLQSSGAIRRVAAVPNHYALGVTANGMSVWNVGDEVVDEIGAKVGALPFVTHCYRRPRSLPDWPYNLFAMVHGKSRQDVLTLINEIEVLIGDNCTEHEVLFSSKILKKTGLRL